MSALMIPYEALGIALVIMLLLRPFLFRESPRKPFKPNLPILKDRRQATDEDPWAKEIRNGGNKATQFKNRHRK